MPWLDEESAVFLFVIFFLQLEYLFRYCLEVFRILICLFLVLVLVLLLFLVLVVIHFSPFCGDPLTRGRF